MNLNGMANTLNQEKLFTSAPSFGVLNEQDQTWQESVGNILTFGMYGTWKILVLPALGLLCLHMTGCYAKK